MSACPFLAVSTTHYLAARLQVKLIDLGMAGLYRPAKLLFGCMGSPGFIAPEVVLGDAHTVSAALYRTCLSTVGRGGASSCCRRVAVCMGWHVSVLASGCCCGSLVVNLVCVDQRNCKCWNLACLSTVSDWAVASLPCPSWFSIILSWYAACHACTLPAHAAACDEHRTCDSFLSCLSATGQLFVVAFLSCPIWCHRLQPAMDVYSLGVLLFVMLVGKKPWDAQRSHTLQYAVLRTAEAPGLADPNFLALSQPARELLLCMLQEEPACRPTAAQVLAHKWMLQAVQVGPLEPAAVIHIPCTLQIVVLALQGACHLTLEWRDAAKLVG